jgi:hypothetical protein
MDRRRSAVWASTVLGRRITASALRSWELRGALRRQRPGRRHPAGYGEADLVRLLLVATLRAEGLPVRRAAIASRDLGHVLTIVGPDETAYATIGGRVVLARDEGALASWAYPIPLSAWRARAREALQETGESR